MLTNEDTCKLHNVEEELEDVTNAKKADNANQDCGEVEFSLSTPV